MKTAAIVLSALLLATPIATQAKTRQTRTTPYKPPVVTVPIVLTPAEQAARDEVNRMGAELDRADGVTFDAAITYPVGASQHQCTATVTLEHPAKLIVTSSNTAGKSDGYVSADGSVCTIFNKTSNTYVVIAISRDLYSLNEALKMGLGQIFPAETDEKRNLIEALIYPELYFSGEYTVKELQAGETLHYTQENTTSPTGQPVTLISEILSSTRAGTEEWSYTIDPSTNLPQQLTETYIRVGAPPVTVLQETFKNIKLVHTPVAESDYAFTPPPGSTAYNPN